MTARATGRHVRRDGADTLVFERSFAAPVADVWAAVTESERLGRWIGTWRGNPASGAVQFQMNAEGDDVAEETYEIRECVPPRLLVLHAEDDYGVWDLTLELAEAGGTTTLAFSQVIHDRAVVESIGPGWDYYLDRLVAAQAGADVAALHFADDYFPALSPHYAALMPARPQ